MTNIINHQTKHESWEEGRVELKPLTAEDEDIKVIGKQIAQDTCLRTSSNFLFYS